MGRTHLIALTTKQAAKIQNPKSKNKENKFVYCKASISFMIYCKACISFMISNKIESALSEIEPVNERIICAHFNGNPAVTVIVHYSPTEGSNTAEDHYSNLTKNQFDAKAQRCTSHGRFQFSHWKGVRSVYLSWAYQQKRQVTAVPG